jgi:hypothetical protein
MKRTRMGASLMLSKNFKACSVKHLRVYPLTFQCHCDSNFEDFIWLYRGLIIMTLMFNGSNAIISIIQTLSVVLWFFIPLLLFTATVRCDSPLHVKCD